MPPGAGEFTSPGADRDPFRLYRTEFLDYLRQSGLSESAFGRLLGPARHFLTWLEQEGLSIAAIDDAVLCRFRDHVCRCPWPSRGKYRANVKRSRKDLSGVLWLVRFFEETGRTGNPEECDNAIRLLEAFLEHLGAESYKPLSIAYYRRVCKHFVIWLRRSRIAIGEVDSNVIERFLHHECFCSGSYRKQHRHGRSPFAIEQFIGFLRSRGVMPCVRQGSGRTSDDAVPGFGTWLRQHRGIQESSIGLYVREVSALLPVLSDDPSLYDAALIRNALLRRFDQVSRAQASSAATSMRMYLRFLVSTGACPPELIGAVPTARSWRLSRLPRYISGADIERVIASCDTATPGGIRDRAILLLLARLALRAGDITGLRLGDVNWENASLRVCGKSKRSTRLPLPQDAGDALLTYIEQVRQRVNDSRVFLTVQAPYHPLPDSKMIAGIVCRALKRAGINDAPVRGAYLLRHSAATDMLRSGATLEMIGNLLRHRSPDTTVIYAKVNQPMLQEVAQPWIGDA